MPGSYPRRVGSLGGVARSAAATVEHRAFAADVAAITTAFGDPTRRAAWLFARDAGPDGVTVAEVAEHLGLHPNVARHHLDKLTASTYLVVSSERADGAARAAGRPAKRYRVPPEVAEAAADGPTGFPARRDDLLIQLLGRALALLPHDVAEAMAEDVGEQHGRALAASMAGASADAAAAASKDVRVALHAVADALTAHGFAAHTDSHHDSLRIINNHCPFGDVAIEHPVICAVDRGMVKGMLQALYGGEAEPLLEASLPQGDTMCVTAV